VDLGKIEELKPGTEEFRAALAEIFDEEGME